MDTPMWMRADGDDIQEMDRGSIQEVDGGVEEVGELLLLLPRERGMDPCAGTIFLAASRVDERGRRRGQAESGGPPLRPTGPGSPSGRGTTLRDGSYNSGAADGG
jgi:hypothetical protein